MAYKAGCFGVIIYGSLLSFEGLPSVFLSELQIPKTWKILDIASQDRKGNAYIYDWVDQSNKNVRIWTHNQSLSTSWSPISDIPLSEGYAFIWTYYSRLWEGWFYGVMSAPNWKSGEIPRPMALQQSLFFIDWYGVKYLTAAKGMGIEWDIADHFYQKSDYVEDFKVDNGSSVFKISDKYTSPIISSVNTPVIGFVGSDDSYMTVVKDLATLNLNTAYLIPVKLSTTLSGITASKLQYIDGLIIYDYQKGFLGDLKWSEIYDFVNKGGKVWIETGGNSLSQMSDSLPAVFPISKNSFGPLDEDWIVSGELSTSVDFSVMSKLNYKGTVWKLSYTNPNDIRPGAKVLLTEKGYPIAVSQDIGKGKVVWTGGNFWYRPEEFRQNGINEDKIIDFLIHEMMGGLPYQRVTASVDRPTPEHILVEGENFSGVTFKENHWPGWVAKVKVGSRSYSVPIFTAGPELMYIPIPKNYQGQQIEVNIDYLGGFISWIGLIVTILSFGGCFFYLISGRLIKVNFDPKILMANFIKKSHSKISGWWDKEEQ